MRGSDIALYDFTASTDFVGKAKRLRGVYLSQGAGAQTVNLRDGGASGTIKIQIQVPATSSKEVNIDHPGIVFVNSLYVEVVGTGFAKGAVELQ
jgi:hypothetical protein